MFFTYLHALQHASNAHWEHILSLEDILLAHCNTHPLSQKNISLQWVKNVSLEWVKNVLLQWASGPIGCVLQCANRMCSNRMCSNDKMCSQWALDACCSALQPWPIASYLDPMHDTHSLNVCIYIERATFYTYRTECVYVHIQWCSIEIERIYTHSMTFCIYRTCHVHMYTYACVYVYTHTHWMCVAMWCAVFQLVKVSYLYIDKTSKIEWVNISQIRWVKMSQIRWVNMSQIRWLKISQIRWVNMSQISCVKMSQIKWVNMSYLYVDKMSKMSCLYIQMSCLYIQMS